LPQLSIPAALQEITQPNFTTPLPINQPLLLDSTLPLALYTSYQLNPHWRAAENLNRLLILAPSHFNKYPVSAQVISFVLDLAQNLITGIHIFVGEVEDIPGIANFPAIYHQQHPLTQDFPGTATPSSWMFPEATYRGQGFFGYWKQCEKTLK
jgi:deoxyribodipyrimidine photo-lyase